MKRSPVLTLALMVSLPVPASPASAQNGASPSSSVACEQPGQPDEVVICGRPDEPEVYRIPRQDGFDPRGTAPSVSLERHMLLDPGAAGIGSCSTTGPGGWTGCQVREWERNRLQWAGRRPGGQRGDVSIRIGPMNAD